jgi:hypothetical protein
MSSFAATAAAQPAPGGWDGPGYGAPAYLEPPGTRDPREGKVQVQTFAASTPAVAALGHGPITINPGGDGPDQGLFEAAVADQLSRTGYQVGATGAGQALDLVVRRQVVQPPEPPHSPIRGGGVDVGVGGGGRHYGSGVGLGIALDFSKPLSALISTEIEVRIQDATTHELLWQGRAELLSREADKRWRPDAIAGRLTAALFRNFPAPIRR